MQKISTLQRNESKIFKEHQLTVGLDPGDRWSRYCAVNEIGDIVLEHKVTTTPEAMKQVFGKMQPSRIALETGARSP